MHKTPLADVENALIEASNALNDIENIRDYVGFKSLDDAIDSALRLVQAWREEAERTACGRED